MSTKWTLGLVAILLSTTIGTAAEGGKKIKCPNRMQVFAEPVIGQSFAEYQDLSESLVAAGESTVVSTKAGTVTEIPATVGQDLRAGQPIVRLALPAELASEIAQLKKSIESVNAQLLKAKKAKQTKRAASLQKRFDDTVAELKEKSALAETFTINAPVDGRVIALNVENGAQVAENAPIARLTDASRLKVTVQVSSIADFKEGEPVTLKVAGAPVQGTQHLAGDTLEVVVANADRSLTPGAIAQFRLPLKQHQNAPVLAQDRILRDDQGEFVYLAVQNRAVRSPLTIHARENGLCLVDKGLAVGDQLILTGFSCLTDGKKIKVLPKEKLLALEEKKARKEAEKARKAELKKKEEPRAEDVKTEQPKTEKTAPAETAAPGKFPRLRVGVNGSYYSMTADSFSGLYGKMVGFDFDLSYRFTDKIDLWIAAGTASKKTTQAWSGSDEYKFSMVPVSADLRYRFLRKQKFDLLAGIGVTMYRIKDISPLETLEETLVGFNALAGIEYRLSPKFSFQTLLRFNKASKDIRENVDNKLDLSNLELTLGLGYAF
ncbi:MAG TPA: efflux RND transporter periplasmic adaptor subunit [Candidatus Aminicenantes bacterium]|nr:efflux RND transporter periplasmic adaptor subunit [Candidatus Aminicenantes bacterium]